MIIAGTGHRPNKLGGYSAELDTQLAAFAAVQLNRLRPSGVISGMALGWDRALAVASVRLSIPFVAAVPFEGFGSRWPKASQIAHNDLLKLASQVHIVCSRHDLEQTGVNRALQARNEWMVDNSQAILALWNGDRSGGTWNCIEYAKEGRRWIDNVWPAWEDWYINGSYLI